MTRRADWLLRLEAEIANAGQQPFEWGRTDCCKFAARCVDAMTDSGWLATLTYTDQRSALRFLAAEGGIEQAVTRRFGQPVPWVRAMRGDLVLFASADGVGSLGLSLGATSAVVLEDRGIAYLPTKSALACWRVP